MSYYSDCMEKFRLLPDDLRENLGSDEALLKIQKLELEFGVELKFLVVLVAIGELQIEDIPAFLIKSQNVPEDEARFIQNELLLTVFDFLEEPDPEMIKEIFKNKLRENIENRRKLRALNKGLFFNLILGASDPQELLKILLTNNEEITKGELILDKAPSKPTIANWVKDFMRGGGGDKFDKLLLANYISTSKNAMRLASAEKDKLRMILGLFQNLKFYPMSLPETEGEKWKPIPVEEKTEQINIKKAVRQDEASAPIARPEAPKQKPAVTAKTEEKKDDWEALLKKYPAGSLERKAILEEMRRGRVKS